MSRPSSSSSSNASLLSAYAVPIDIPTSWSDPHITKHLTKFHHATKAGERCSILLTLAELTFNRSSPSDALLFYSAAVSLSLSSSPTPLDTSTLITVLRRIGECHHQLLHFTAAVDAFQSALDLLSSLPSSTSTAAQRLRYEVHLSLGNAFLDWADDEDSSLSASLSRAIHAHTHHQESLHSAHSLAGLGKRGRAEKPMTAAQAAVVMRANINLGNTMTQLIHFDNIEIKGRARTAAAAVTDSSSSSSSALSPPSSPPSSSPFSDPASAPVDSNLSTLSTSTLHRHRRLRFLAASAFFDTALALAVSHKGGEARMIHENMAAMHEGVGQMREASECYERAAGGTGWQWKASAMLMWMRAERWDEAMQLADEVRSVLERKGGGSRTEKDTAREQLDLVDSVWRKVHREQRLHADIDRLLEDEEGSGEDEVDLPHLRHHIGLLHSLISVSVSLAESGIGVDSRWASVMVTHQRAIALVTSVTAPPSDLITAVYGYHACNVVRYLPHIIRVKVSLAEVEEAVVSALKSIRTARTSPAPGEPGLIPVLSLFEAQLALQCGVDLTVVMEALQRAWGEVEEAEKEQSREMALLKAEILAVMEEVLSVRGEEGGEGPGDSELDRCREWVTRTAREARMQVEANEEQTDEEDRWLTRRLWGLPDKDEDQDSHEGITVDEVMEEAEDLTPLHSPHTSIPL